MLASFMCLLLFCSCKTKYVPVETVKTDSIYINKVVRDSIHLHDSVYVKEGGDTVWVEKYRYLYKDKWRTDTLYVTQTDSVQVPYPIEKELTKWETLCINVGGWVIGIVIITILVVVGKMVYKLKK